MEGLTWAKRVVPRLLREHGRGPCEREAIQLAYGGNECRSDGLELVWKARAKDRPWERSP